MLLFILASLIAQAPSAATPSPWTAGRAFSNARVYVLPPQTLQAQFGLQYQALLDGSGTIDFLSQYALQWGLGHGVQLDVDAFVEQNGYLSPLQLQGEDLRVRWAWADWGVLWGNPTVMARLSRLHSLPPEIALTVDLGDTWFERLHAALRLSWTRQLLGVSTEQTYALHLAALWDTCEPSLRAGGEISLDLQDHAGARFAFDSTTLRAGPSLQWIPLPPMSLLLVANVGWQLQQGDASSSSWLVQPHLLVTYAW